MLGRLRYLICHKAYALCFIVTNALIRNRLRLMRAFFGIIGFFLVIFFPSLTLSRQDGVTMASDKSVVVDVTSFMGPLPYMGPKLVINVAARQMHVYLGGKHVKTYPIAVGTGGYPTPLGPRSLDQVVLNAWWFPPDSEWAKDDKPTPPGKNNPLGSLKMRLGGTIMAHGTNKPKTIGTPASHGCIRMFTEDAKELALWVVANVASESVALFSEAEAHQGRSYYINLPQSVPVEVVYDIVELKNDELLVYRDIYSRVPNKIDAIRTELELFGVDCGDVDFTLIETRLKETRNREDLSFPYSEILISQRERQKSIQMANIPQQGA